MIIVADSAFAALDLLAAVRRHVCAVTRLRLDASLFEPAPVRPNTAAWYCKPEPGFSVAIAAARFGPLRIVPSPGN